MHTYSELTKSIKAITLPVDYNYIALFLTFRCQLKCHYCINKINNLQVANELDGKAWVNIINRIETRNIPVTLQGGEPSLHRDFYYIVNNIKEDIHVDLLTNLSFDMREFMQNIPPERLKRDAPYASIRVSYHPVTMEYDDLKKRVLLMLDRGYHAGIWAVLHPQYEDHILKVKEDAVNSGIDFRVKSFMGFHEDRLFGEYHYPDAVSKLNENAEHDQKEVLCRTTELIIAPNGMLYNCHHDLYTRYNPVADMSDEDVSVTGEYRVCSRYGYCNPCDIKKKFNRFQEWGHCSVHIKE